MQPKRVGIYLLILFAIFFIVSDPDGAGTFGRAFFAWLGDGLSNALDFFDSLFAGDEEIPPVTTTTTQNVG